MPIYAYRCSACGHAQDVLQKISDPKLTVCPACGQDTYVKQLTAAGFQLKGTGWYVTDFRDGGQGKKPKTDDAKPGQVADGDKAGKAADGAPAADAGKTAAPASADAAAKPAAPAPAPASAPAAKPPSPAATPSKD